MYGYFNDTAPLLSVRPNLRHTFQGNFTVGLVLQLGNLSIRITDRFLSYNPYEAGKCAGFMVSG